MTELHARRCDECGAVVEYPTDADIPNSVHPHRTWIKVVGINYEQDACSAICASALIDRREVGAMASAVSRGK